MKNQWVGDIKDYAKYGLLRRLCIEGNFPPLRLGLLWYLTPDQGQHPNPYDYLNGLQGPHHNAEPEVFGALRQIIHNPPPKTAQDVERAGLFGGNALSMAMAWNIRTGCSMGTQNGGATGSTIRPKRLQMLI